MIIESKGRTPITELEMCLSINNRVVNFRHYVPPLNYCEPMDYDRSSRGYITFADSREIDALIIMLEQFRKTVVGQVCDWQMNYPMATVHPWEPMSAEEVLSKIVERGGEKNENRMD